MFSPSSLYIHHHHFAHRGSAQEQRKNVVFRPEHSTHQKKERERDAEYMEKER